MEAALIDATVEPVLTFHIKLFIIVTYVKVISAIDLAIYLFAI